MSDWKVELVNDSVNELYVEFQGPKDSEHPSPDYLHCSVLEM